MAAAPSLTGDAPAVAPRGRIAAEVDGDGPAVLLVHGVGYGPGTLRDVARAVAGGGGRAVTAHRAGYGASADVPARTSMEGQLDDAVSVLDALGIGRAVWAGVSGGATIALAAAIHRPERVAGAVVHEPALGPLAAGLDARLRDAAAAVAAADDPGAGALALARALAGPDAWGEVSEQVRDQVRAAGAAVRAEVPLFPAFAPGPVELDVLRGVPMVSSVGARSGPERHRAGEVLVALSGCRAALTPSGHLVQIEAPGALAALALGLIRPAPSTTHAEEEG